MLQWDGCALGIITSQVFPPVASLDSDVLRPTSCIPRNPPSASCCALNSNFQGFSSHQPGLFTLSRPASTQFRLSQRHSSAPNHSAFTRYQSIPSSEPLHELGLLFLRPGSCARPDQILRRAPLNSRTLAYIQSDLHHHFREIHRLHFFLYSPEHLTPDVHRNR